MDGNSFSVLERKKYHFSGPVTTIHDRRLPEAAVPAGYAALMDALSLDVPVPARLWAIGNRHSARTWEDWRILTPRHAPAATLEGHLTFALKYEGVDLAVLKRLFMATGPEPITAIAKAKPTGTYARRVWFLFEWLTGAKLDLPNLTQGRYVDALDADLQYAASPVTSMRHRVRNNLPGTPAFCPLVFRTPGIDAFAALDLGTKARAVAAKVPADILARAAAFLLLKDSRASYVIEGEEPPRDRVQRWSRAIGQAGRHAIDLEELLRLQRIVLGDDDRFVALGLRTEGGFVGEHDRDTRAPLPEHISARPQDLPGLIDGLVAFEVGAGRQIDPVIAAAVLAFGFVFIHPFEDGNGRLHRYLIHHMLALRAFSPKGLVFPISAALLERIDDYRVALEAYSTRVLPHIAWRANERGNVDVLNDTSDYYRYFDATPQTELLYDCVRKTIEEDLPGEAEYLRRYDAFGAAVEAVVEMPKRTVDLLFRSLKQNGGRFSKRARNKEFARLTDSEAEEIEQAYSRAFDRDAG